MSILVLKEQEAVDDKRLHGGLTESLHSGPLTLPYFQCVKCIRNGEKSIQLRNDTASMIQHL